MMPSTPSVQQPAHLDRVIDRPDVHLQSGCLRGRREPGGDDRHAPAADSAPAQPRAVARNRRAGRWPGPAGRSPGGPARWRRPARQVARSAASSAVGERTETDPADDTGLQHQLRPTAPPAPAAFASMLNLASGNSSSRSASSGIGSVPPILACRTSLHGSSATAPDGRSPGPAGHRGRRSTGRPRWPGHRSRDSGNPRRRHAGTPPSCSPGRPDRRCASRDGRTPVGRCPPESRSPPQSGTSPISPERPVHSNSGRRYVVTVTIGALAYGRPVSTSV